MNDEQNNIHISYIPAEYLLHEEPPESELPSDAGDYEHEAWPEPPRWTAQRIIYLIIALLMIITFLFYLLWPLIDAIATPPPSPPRFPGTPPAIL